MRIIVSGGGTGGHIYPALTIIREIQRLEPTAEFLYVGTKAGLEADIVAREGLPFVTVDISGFSRSPSPVNLWRIAKAGIGTLEAMNIVRRFRPNVAIGTGGYVSGPVLLAAALLGVPTLVEEQNAIAGITNKILAKFVTKIAVGVSEAAAFFPAEKTVFTGNPIRREVRLAERTAAQKEFQLDSEKKTILVSGGSRGAVSINRAMIGVIEHFAQAKNLQILFATGNANFAVVEKWLNERGLAIDSLQNIQVLPYIYDMPQALAAADLAIFRAGAMGLSELTARGIPAILVPFPYAAENHQEKNAVAFVNGGAGEMILDRDLTSEKLIEAVERLVNDEARLSAMAAASQRLGKPEAAAKIAKLVLEIANTDN